VRLILRQRAVQAGYRAAALARLTPHSLRAGCITALAQARLPERDIMTHSRHGSPTVMRGYIRQAGGSDLATALWGDAAALTAVNDGAQPQR
jgi:integrase